MHKSGFVNIIGRPNVGKSTLMNTLVGERMSIITSKPQTTRHRIIGIVNDEHHQVVFSDTPGIIKDPAYKMQEAMNNFVKTTFEDADVMLFVTDIFETYGEDDPIIQRLNNVKDIPIVMVLNKVDLGDQDRIKNLMEEWKERIEFSDIVPISALHDFNTKNLFDKILGYLGEGPAYYPKEQFTDRPERFFVSEIIREKILIQYKQEIPYSCEVVVERFKEDEVKDLIRIYAVIYVARKTQKSIIIGKGGIKIKHLGIEARKSIEEFLGKQIYLELFVKVKENWRDDDRLLKSFGYNK